MFKDMGDVSFQADISPHTLKHIVLIVNHSSGSIILWWLVILPRRKKESILRCEKMKTSSANFSCIKT